MKYKEHYTRLCESRQKLNRSKGKGTYYESHHIIPRSLGGEDTESNLVLLTAREHYIAHLLLYCHYKTIGGLTFRKMSFALVSMAAVNKRVKRNSLSSMQYATIREAAIHSRLGVKIKDTSNYKKPKTESHKDSIRLARLQSPPRSLVTRIKMSQTRINRNIPWPGNNTMLTCPHCNKNGQTNAMKRWHFNNCKKVNHAQLA